MDISHIPKMISNRKFLMFSSGKQTQMAKWKTLGVFVKLMSLVSVQEPSSLVLPQVRSSATRTWATEAAVQRTVF